MVNVEKTTLLQVITKPENLTSLNLWKVCISVGYSDDLDDLPSSWSTLLTDLLKKLPATSALSSMLIGFPSEVISMEGAITVPTRFIDQPEVFSQTRGLRGAVDRVSYRGPDLKHWLEDYAAIAVRESSLLQRQELSLDEEEDEDDDDDDLDGFDDDLDDDDISE